MVNRQWSMGGCKSNFIVNYYFCYVFRNSNSVENTIHSFAILVSVSARHLPGVFCNKSVLQIKLDQMAKRVFVFFQVMVLLHVISMAQPKGMHLSWNGSSEVKTATTIALTWINEKQEDASIEYGVGADRLKKRVKVKPVYSSSLKAYIYKSTLRKLSPSTYYYYRAGSEKNGWSKIYKFKTGPLPGSKSKIVVGIWSDTQNNEGNLHFEQTDAVVKQMSKGAYYLTLHNGDIVENGAVASSWKGFFDVAEPLNANYPLMCVTGNHDVVNDTASAHFQRPFPVFYDLMNLPSNQLNYSYDYGNTHFVAINSGFAQAAAKVGKVLFAENSDEYRWLEADLARARSNNHITWIIMYSHYPIHSFGFSHIPTWQHHVKPLVDKYKVDLYLAGHRHVYERHKAVRGSEIFEPTDSHLYSQPQGTIYITNGSCGGSLQGIGGWDLKTMLFTPREKKYAYAVMTIEGNTITYSVSDNQGNEMDYFKIVK
jgi:acid phosphatase type 7